ncbi:MAG: response regulator transcription factor [Actinomycetota bacterium]
MAPTALVVDDHAAFRAVARRLLEGGGFEVVGEASDGAGAIAAARELRPDLVLLDIGLPDMDGIRVAERLATEGARPTVVLTSGRESSDYGDRIAASAAAGFVSKGELTAGRLRAFVAGVAT